MRTGIPLATIRKEVLIEAGFSTDSGSAVFSKEKIDQLIARTERMMARQNTWPGIHFEERLAVPADAQFVSMPVGINYSDISAVHVAFGDDWLPVKYGIGAPERAIYDETQRATPILRWEVVAPGTTQFEVWPVGSQDQVLMFEGSKALGVFEDDTSTCTLDADVIVMRVAAEILGRDRKEDAALKLDMARQMTTDIIKGQTATRGAVNMGGARRGPRLRPGIDYIPSGST